MIRRWRHSRAFEMFSRADGSPEAVSKLAGSLGLRLWEDRQTLDRRERSEPLVKGRIVRALTRMPEGAKGMDRKAFRPFRGLNPGLGEKLGFRTASPDPSEKIE